VHFTKSLGKNKSPYKLSFAAENNKSARGVLLSNVLVMWKVAFSKLITLFTLFAVVFTERIMACFTKSPHHFIEKQKVQDKVQEEICPAHHMNF